jgi:GNAT superfamily N-acetyltransferase
MLNDLTLVYIADLDPAQFAIVAAIYREAFEAPWEMPVADLCEFAAARGRSSSTGRALALLEGNEPVAIALASYLRYQNLLYLKYLAVASTHRDRGIGGQLLRLISNAGEEISQMFGLDGCRGTLIEVERPDDSLSVAERDLRIRRIDFYLRNGAVPSGTLFEHPAWAPPEMPNWDIMILPGYAWTGSLDEPSRQALSSFVLAEMRASLGLEIKEV